MTIQELCREKKNALGMTAQDIASTAGIPLSTVNNFFAHASKSPALYTTAGLCAALGVSLDEFFKIGEHHTATEKTLQAEKDSLEKHLSSKGETIDLLYHGIKTRNRIIAALLGIIILVTAYAIYLDMNALNIGFWRG